MCQKELFDIMKINREQENSLIEAEKYLENISY